MKWDVIEDRNHMENFLTTDGKVKGVQDVTMHFTDGYITHVTLELKDGTVFSVSHDRVNDDGSRKTLFVSVSDPVKDKD